eukprot:15342092-Ditylum_brightwellii.AAC.1
MQQAARGPDGRTGYEEVTGNTSDISEYTDFNFYDLVWYYPHKHPGVGDEDRLLGCWLGVSHQVGSFTCHWILTKAGHVVSKTTVHHVTHDKYLHKETKKQIEESNEAVDKRLNDDHFKNNDLANFYLDDELDDPAYRDGTNTPTDEKYDGAEVDIVDGQGEVRRGKVVWHAQDHSGEPKGHAHRTPLMDMQEYKIEYDDGTVDCYHANVRAENLYSQVDAEG